MYNIQLSNLAGKQFYGMDKNVTWTCVGYGDATDTGRLLIVGMTKDTNNETIIRTFRDNDVHFIN